jgi:hypothetical protein
MRLLTRSFTSEIHKRMNTTDIKLNSVALVRKRTIQIERSPLVGEVNANFCG